MRLDCGLKADKAEGQVQMLTWKLLVIWEVILCELYMDGSHLSWEVVAFAAAGEQSGWLLTWLSRCGNLSTTSHCYPVSEPPDTTVS